MISIVLSQIPSKSLLALGWKPSHGLRDFGNLGIYEVLYSSLIISHHPSLEFQINSLNHIFVSFLEKQMKNRANAFNPSRVNLLPGRYWQIPSANIFLSLNLEKKGISFIISRDSRCFSKLSI